jgi:pyruvate/2-oxoglutarate dehydrogenase complex dihydrolipoamide acyltransferase (E2) component
MATEQVAPPVMEEAEAAAAPPAEAAAAPETAAAAAEAAPASPSPSSSPPQQQATPSPLTGTASALGWLNTILRQRWRGDFTLETEELTRQEIRQLKQQGASGGGGDDMKDVRCAADDSAAAAAAAPPLQTFVAHASLTLFKTSLSNQLKHALTPLLYPPPSQKGLLRPSPVSSAA